MTSRRRWCPHRHCALQQLESNDCVFAPHVFSIEEIKTNTDFPVYGPGYEKTVHVYEVAQTKNSPAKTLMGKRTVNGSASRKAVIKPQETPSTVWFLCSTTLLPCVSLILCSTFEPNFQTVSMRDLESSYEHTENYFTETGYELLSNVS